MKIFPVQRLTGMNNFLSRREIEDNNVFSTVNTIFEQGKVFPRYGLSLFAEGFNGAVKAIANFNHINNEQQLVIITTTDAYRYDITSGNISFLTPCYSTGTISISAGSLSTVTGTGTEWKEMTGSPAYFKIGFGSTDPDAIIDWYDILQVNTDTSILLAAENVERTDEVYVIRQCFSMTEYDNASVEIVPSYEYNENLLYLANGVDPVRVWHGFDETENLLRMVDVGVHYKNCTWTDSSATITINYPDTTLGIYQNMDVDGIVDDSDDPVFVLSIDHSSSTVTLNAEPKSGSGATGVLKFYAPPPVGKYLKYTGAVGFEHLLLGDVIVDGERQHNTIFYSNAGEPDNWAGNYYALKDTNEEITAIERLAGRVFVYKPSSISEMYPDPNGGNSDPFNINQSRKTEFGSGNGRNLIPIGSAHVVYTADNIYLFDSVSEKPIGTPVYSDIKTERYANSEDKNFAFNMPALGKYVLFITTDETYPYKAWVFDYRYDSWTKWQFPIRFTCHGEYTRDSSPKVNQYQEDGIYTIEREGSSSGTTITLASTSGLKADMKVEADGILTAMTDTADISGNVLTVTDTSSYSHGMKVEGTGIPEHTYIQDIRSATEITLTNSCTTGTAISIDIYPAVYISSVDSATEITVDQSLLTTSGTDFMFFETLKSITGRFLDYIIQDDNVTHLLGTEDGKVYEISSRYAADYLTGPYGAETAITAGLYSKDYWINDPYNTLKLLKIMMGLKQEDGEIKIRASADHGTTWSEWIELDMNDIDEYNQLTANFFERGRSVMFEIENVSGSYFELENIMIGYNDSGEKQ